MFCCCFLLASLFFFPQSLGVVSQTGLRPQPHAQVPRPNAPKGPAWRANGNRRILGYVFGSMSRPAGKWSWSPMEGGL
ncbi:hypothetical protein V6N13_105385 [Hibiscus sabdariffa]